MQGPVAFRDPFGDEAFAHYYREKIQPHHAAFERKRLDAATETSRRSLPGGLLLLGLLALAGVGLFALHWSLFVTGLATGLPALGVWAWMITPGVDYEQEVRSTIWPLLFAFFGPDFRYFSRGRSPGGTRMFIQSGLMHRKADWTLGDRVCGSYRGMALHLEEARARRVKGKETVTLFQGIVISVKLQRSIRGRTLVFRDDGPVRRFFRDDDDDPGLPRVRLEDPEFERTFEVYAEDQIEARVLLTPAFMERLRQLSRRHGDELQCSFAKGWLHIFLATPHDYFAVRISLLERVSFAREAAVVRDEMEAIFEMVDALKLAETAGAQTPIPVPSAW